MTVVILTKNYARFGDTYDKVTMRKSRWNTSESVDVEDKLEIRMGGEGYGRQMWGALGHLEGLEFRSVPPALSPRNCPL